MNGLALLPVWYWGTEEQKQRVLTAATSDPTGECIVGYGASEPAGTPGGTANFDTPLPSPAGIGLTARLDGDSYVLNGRKYWPCNVGGWDGRGANTEPRRGPDRPEQGRHRGTGGHHGRPRYARGHLRPHRHLRPPPHPELRDHLRQRAGARGEHGRGNPRQRRPPDQPQLRLVRAGRRHRRRRRRASGVRTHWTGRRPTPPVARTRSSTTSTSDTFLATSPGRSRRLGTSAGRRRTTSTSTTTTASCSAR